MEAMTTGAFDDLLASNRRYARSFPHGFDGIAHEGVLILTCMDSRLEPLEMVGLILGEAKILRTAGAHMDQASLSAIILGVHLLRVNRILIVPHTKCAAAALTDATARERILAVAGVDAGDFAFDLDGDPETRLRRDVEMLRQHPLVGPYAQVGGFVYDVDTGLLEQTV